MIKNKNNQLYIFSLAFFFTHFFFLLYGHNIIRISGNDTLIACLLGIIIDVFLFTITKIALLMVYMRSIKPEVDENGHIIKKPVEDLSDAEKKEQEEQK